MARRGVAALLVLTLLTGVACGDTGGATFDSDADFLAGQIAQVPIPDDGGSAMVDSGA